MFCIRTIVFQQYNNIIIIIIIIICCTDHHNTTLKHDLWLDEACGMYEGEDNCVHNSKNAR